MPISKSDNKPRPFGRVGNLQIKKGRGKPSPCAQGLDKPIVCLTIGDPSGIGSEVILKSLKDPKIKRGANFLIIGDYFIIKKTSLICKLHLPIRKIESINKIDFKNSSINLLDINNCPKNKFKFGKISDIYGRRSVEYLKKALSFIKENRVDALVTAPISKEAINLAGYNIQGHTEFLASCTNTKKFAMMLVGGNLRVVLITTHMALKDVHRYIKPDKIYDAIFLANSWLKRYFKIKKPHIGVCALNPHAGEAGLFGYEETKFIMPAIKKARQYKKICIEGPIPADSIFWFARDRRYDAVICMYHDQGLIPLKMLARDSAVNVTLGLPFVRTSPAHGTAFDIAGKNKANPSSMKEAIKLAIYLAKHR